jgi:hypothetical protein
MGAFLYFRPVDTRQRYHVLRYIKNASRQGNLADLWELIRTKPRRWLSRITVYPSRPNIRNSKSDPKK